MMENNKITTRTEEEIDKEIMEKVAKGEVELRPLFYDGSGRHPRYHYYDPPFGPFNPKSEWFWSLVLILVIVFSPILWIIDKICCMKEKCNE